MICEFTLFAPLTTPTQTCLSSMCLPPPHALLLQPHVLEFARVCKFPSFLALRKSGLRPRRIAAIFSDDRFFWVCLCLSIRVSARWLWERVPEAVRSDEDMSRIWEVAKLLRNGDMQPAYAQLANAGTAFVSPFRLFGLATFNRHQPRSRHMSSPGKTLVAFLCIGLRLLPTCSTCSQHQLSPRAQVDVCSSPPDGQAQLETKRNKRF